MELLRLLGPEETSAAFFWPEQAIGSACIKGWRNRPHFMIGRDASHIYSKGFGYKEEWKFGAILTIHLLYKLYLCK